MCSGVVETNGGAANAQRCQGDKWVEVILLHWKLPLTQANRRERVSQVGVVWKVRRTSVLEVVNCQSIACLSMHDINESVGRSCWA